MYNEVTLQAELVKVIDRAISTYNDKYGDDKPRQTDDERRTVVRVLYKITARHLAKLDLENPDFEDQYVAWLSAYLEEVVPEYSEKFNDERNP